MKFNLLFDILLLKYPLIVFLATGLIIKLNKNQKIIPKSISSLIKRKDAPQNKKQISFERVFLLALKLILGWFIFSFISTFLICADSHDGFCGLAILGFLGEPLLIFADILATLQLYKLPFLFQIISALKEVGFALLVGLWILSWFFIAWVCLKIKDNIEYFTPNKDKIKIFLIFFIIFGPLSFLCTSNWDQSVNDPKYCPPSGSHYGQEIVACDDPRYQGGLDNRGNCIISSGGTDYDCLLCKYPSFGPTFFKFRKPGTELEGHFFLFILLLVLIEYLISCWLYHKKIKNIIPKMLFIAGLLILFIVSISLFNSYREKIDKIKELQCEVLEGSYADKCYLKKSEITEETFDKIKICRYISTERKINNCIISVAIQKSSLEVCNNYLTTEALKKECYNSVDRCSTLTISEKLDCYTELAIERRDNNYCVNLKSQEEINACYLKYSTELKDLSSCRQILSKELKETCLKVVKP